MGQDFSVEQKKALALAAARQRQSQQSDSQDIQDSDVGGFIPFLNKGIAEAIGAPVDLISAGLGAIGIDTGTPFGGSKSIRSGLSAVGIETPDRDPRTTLEFIGATVGEAAGTAIPVAKGAQVLSKGTGVIGGLSRSMIENLTSKPLTALGVESLSAAGAGVGRQVATEQDLGPGGQLAAEVIGGLAGPTIPSIRKLSPHYWLGKGIQKYGPKAVFPFTEAGSFERASARVKSLVSDPEIAAGAIDDLKGSNLLPAARTEEPGLMALEKAVLERDPAEVSRISQRTSDIIEDLRQSVMSSGRVAKSKDFVRAKRERLSKALDANVESAADDARAALDAAGPGVTAEDATILMRGALEQSLADAKVQEAMLWQAIPQKAKTPVRSTVNKYRELQGGLAKAQAGDMPASAASVIGPAAKRNVKKATIQEMDGLYKKLGEEATAARANKEFNKARIAEALRESILDDIARAEGGSEIQEAIQTARQFSKQMNEKFRKGPVGKILGYGREGGPRLEPELALERTVGRGGTAGELSVRAMAKASDNPQVLDGIQQFIKSRFSTEAVIDGIVEPSRAQTFMRKYNQILENFPDLKDQLSVAITKEDVARRVRKRNDGLRRAMDRDSVSTASKFLNAPVGKEIARIFQSSDPQKLMGDIVRTMRKDSTGEAMDGLRAGLSDYILSSIRTGSIDAKGRPVLNGLRLRSMLKDQEFLGVIKKVYSPAEVKRWETVADHIARFQRQGMMKGKSIPIITDKPAWLLDKIAQVAGAKVGAKMSGTTGGSIQSASIGSSAMRQLLQKFTADKARQLLIDAIEDPELMKALLTYRTNLATPVRRRYERTIENWMLGSGARIFEGEDAEE